MSHPGEIIREDCLAPLGLTVTEAAKGLDVSRGQFVGPAQRPQRYFRRDGSPSRKSGVGTAESWLRNQVSYDLWQAKRRSDVSKVKKFSTPEPS
jgi:plasmid maintenance system antidote protein VapI